MEARLCTHGCGRVAGSGGDVCCKKCGGSGGERHSSKCDAAHELNAGRTGNLPTAKALPVPAPAATPAATRTARPVSPPAAAAEPAAQEISLRLAMKCALSPQEFEDYDRLDSDEAFEKVSSVNSLHLEWQSIAELSNLEPFGNLTFLYLQYNRIERIEALDGLEKLQFLALQNNRIRVVENLRPLKMLGYLDLRSNQIPTLDAEELPKSVMILDLRGNGCVNGDKYLSSVKQRLPKLDEFDGVTVSAGDAPPAGSAEVPENWAEMPPVRDGDSAPSAYWQRGALQAGTAEHVRDQIQAYSIEAGADVDRFGDRVERAMERSGARRRETEGKSGLSSSMTKTQMESFKRLSKDLAASSSEPVEP